MTSGRLDWTNLTVVNISTSPSVRNCWSALCKTQNIPAGPAPSLYEINVKCKRILCTTQNIPDGPAPSLYEMNV